MRRQLRGCLQGIEKLLGKPAGHPETITRPTHHGVLVSIQRSSKLCAGPRSERGAAADILH